jgi:hypothetical protein
MWFLIGLWTDLGILERDKPTFMGRRLACPNSFHRPNVVIGDFASQFSIDAENFVLP